MEIELLYPWLKIGHILLAIVAVGFNLTYGILIRRAAREPEHMGHVLRSIKVLDDRFATPAYILLPVLGVVMVFIGGYDITELWILGSLALWAVVAVLGATLYSPTLRRQIASLDAGGPATAEFQSLMVRGNAIGAVIGVVVVVIIGLMVLKPTL